MLAPFDDNATFVRELGVGVGVTVGVGVGVGVTVGVGIGVGVGVTPLLPLHASTSTR